MTDQVAAKEPWRRLLDQAEFNRLATYNAEKSRGIVHTKEWRKQMADLQWMYDQAVRPTEPVN